MELTLHFLSFLIVAQYPGSLKLWLNLEKGDKLGPPTPLSGAVLNMATSVSPLIIASFKSSCSWTLLTNN